jgi:hypothetical protein
LDIHITHQQDRWRWPTQKTDTMKFIEMTGATLEKVINDGEIHSKDLLGSGVKTDSIIRVNQQGDIEVRRSNKWDVIGGLLGNFEERIKKKTGFDWV